MPPIEWDDRNEETATGNRRWGQEPPQMPYSEREEVRKCWPADEEEQDESSPCVRGNE